MYTQPISQRFCIILSRFKYLFLVLSTIITLIFANSMWAAYPGKNGLIIFQDNILGQLFSMNADGSNVIQLTNSPLYGGGGAYVSPDGKKIAFCRGTADGSKQDVYVMDITGETAADPAVQITHFLPGQYAFNASWSPDGSKLVFSVFDFLHFIPAGAPDNQSWMVNVDGTNLTQLTHYTSLGYPNDWWNNEPRFSPDGSQIVISCNQPHLFGPGPDTSTQLCMMNPDGSNEHFISDPALLAGEADFSPDGKQLVFNSNNQNLGTVPAAIYTVPVPAASQIISLATPGLVQVSPNSSSNRYGKFSPNGQLLTIENTACSNASNCGSLPNNVFLSDLTGSIFNNLTQSRGNGAGSNWQPQNYDFKGFQSPLRSSSLNSINAGQAVPVKFSLKGFQGMGIIAKGYPKYIPIACANETVNNAAQSSETSGQSSLQYDATSDTYTYVWKTSSSMASGSCQRLIVKLAFAQYIPGFSGATYTIDFKVK